MFWLIVGILSGAILAAYAALNVFLIRKIVPIFETSPLLIATSSAPDPAALRLEIPTPDGLTLSACLYSRDETSSRGLIIFCHELGGSKWTCMNYCQGLWDAGFDILAFDFRNHGESSTLNGYRHIHWLTEYEVIDVRAVVDFVRRDPILGERSIGLFGVSRGGSAALAAGTGYPGVELIATDSAFPIEPMIRYFFKRWFALHVPHFLYTLAPEWHVRYTMWSVKRFSQWMRGCRFTEVISRMRTMALPQKALLIAGERDSFVPGSVTLEMQRALGECCQDLWIVPRAKHNSARKELPEEYDHRLVQFFAQMSPLGQEAALQPVESGFDM
jgi:uncharacterized protein